MGVLPEHDTVLALLRAGACQVLTGADVKRYWVGRGFAESGPTRVTLLTDACEEAAAVDKAAAAKDLQHAESEMASLDPLSEKYHQCQIAAEHARARLEA